MQIVQPFSVNTASPPDTYYGIDTVDSPLITDLSGNTYQLSAAGFVVINGQQDSTTGGTVAIAWTGGAIWYFGAVVNGHAPWYTQTAPGTPWVILNPPGTSPFERERAIYNLLILPNSQTITLGQPFTVTGNFIGYTPNVPFLSWSDKLAGVSTAGGERGDDPADTITLTSFSLVHPGETQYGTFDFSITDSGGVITTTQFRVLATPGMDITNFTATVPSSGTVRLNCSALPGTLTYHFLWSTAQNRTWRISDQSSSSLPFNITGPLVGSQFGSNTGYYFQMYAMDASGKTGNVSSAIGVVPIGGIAPTEIQGLTISEHPNVPNSIELTFTASEGTAQQPVTFNVYKSLSATGPFTLVQTISSTQAVAVTVQ